MSLVADYGEWGAAHPLETTDGCRYRERHRTLRLFLVTIIKRWGRRGLTAAEIVRGLGCDEAARKSVAGFLGAGNHSGYSEGNPHKWCRKDSTGRWHPTGPLRWDPWLKALLAKRP